MNRWSYMFLGILLFLCVAALRKYISLQTTGLSADRETTLSLIPSEAPTSSVVSGGISQNLPGGSLSSSQGNPSFQVATPQSSQVQGASQTSVNYDSFRSGTNVDPTTKEHTLPSGGREDIVQIGDIVVSQQEAYTGDDITFTVTVQNKAPYKKFIRQLCWESSEGNFGCSPGFNLNPSEDFSISNNGRFTSSGMKSVWVTWTQDGTNYYAPVNNTTAKIRIF